jgi:AraC-like DNA-binding protein
MDRFETENLRLLYYDFANKFNGIYKTYEYSRLCTIIQGEEFITNNKHMIKYDTNQYLLLPPESSIHMEINQPTKALVFELNSRLIKQANEKLKKEYSIDYKTLSQNNYYIGEKNKELIEILNRINDKLLKKSENFEYIIDLYAQELVYSLISNTGARQVLNLEVNNPVNIAIRYMNDNCMQRIRINQLSHDLNMSEANFCQYFKRITNMTPNEYLTNVKLEKAKCMLMRASVTEVAYGLGYENISYFISLFKKRYGITPKQYQKLD